MTPTFLAAGFLTKSPRTRPRTVFGAVCNVTSDSLARGKLKGRHFEFEPTQRSVIYDGALNQSRKQVMVAR